MTKIPLTNILIIVQFVTRIPLTSFKILSELMTKISLANIFHFMSHHWQAVLCVILLIICDANNIDRYHLVYCYVHILTFTILKLRVRKNPIT